MATRPSITVNVRASAANYTTGDPALITTATKIARSGADISEGYKVDTVASPQAVFAQNKNFEDNRNDQWVEWVSLGSSQDDSDTHIVETDSSGDINVLGVNCEDVQVVTDGTTNGITITANSSSKGINLLRDASNTDNGILVTSQDGATGVAVEIDVSGNSTGLLVQAQQAPGITVAMTPDGGVLSPHINLNAVTQLPSGTVRAGHIWRETQSGKDDLRCGIHTATPGYIRVTKQAPCYARSSDISNFTISGTSITDAVITTFAFDTDFRPSVGDRVKVTLWGQVRLGSNDANDITLDVRDTTTAGNDVICSIQVGNPATGHLGNFHQSATYAQTYNLPADGARNFDLVWSGDIDGVSARFTGWVEIEEIPGA